MVWISLLVSQGGYWVAAVSLQLVVVRLTHGNAFEQGQLLFFTFSPNLFMSPFAGVMADRYDRRRLIIASQVGITVMASALGVALALGVTRLELIYVLAFGLGCCVSFAQPVIQAIAADAVPRVSLPSAIGLLSMSINISRVVGPALAVPIVLLGGAVTAFAVYAGAAIVATTLLTRVRLPPTTRPVLRGGWAANLRDGFRHAAARPPILLYLSMVGVGSLSSQSRSSTRGRTASSRWWWQSAWARPWARWRRAS
jgi:MFS family permease